MKNTNNRTLALTLTAVGAFSVATSQAATLYNVNFAGNTGGTGRGSAVSVADGAVYQAGSVGANEWNNIIAPAAAGHLSGLAISDSDGNAGTVALATSGTTNKDFAAYSDTGRDAMNQGWFGSNNNNSTLTFSGLSDTATHDVYVYFSWRWDDGTNDYTITTGTGADLAESLTSNFATATSNAAYVEGTHFVKFTGISSVGGEIAINGAAGGDAGPWSGVQIVSTAVPEPSSSALIGLAGLALILRRRK
ncbi:PEP-CTERM sorting domain-containing protein [Verrucomicrobiaceae bacterium N1E253]|uniref:PEP-CTERM sorting domain-containing protein n=1 Tax=Oceaniferula marina TaxID=2748318 RepID=A0A851GDJ5_9BACT|nr:PEP-CTERM sorting domain-containing protein [Oceaniferula marina]NWK55623.1 PEP-CTERM sorting domain-containing protein [Oceaniferula marina]